ncbi:MAG TPA: RagB/SusD family nutrient uptake outer membrane protein [Prolixibacteraceae bacterium]|nr:RagB/SusD family nutrient uptake outer membrane protein [Prolixibacteraceae bacterium]
MMMKIKPALYIISLLLLGFSCQKDDKFLSDAVPSYLSASEPITNADLQSLTYGNFFAFTGFSQQGSPFDGIISYPILASGECDQISIAANTSYRNMDHWFTRKNEDVDLATKDFWTHIYYVTNQASLVISKLGQFTDKVEIEPILEGQNRFLRALTNYAGVLCFGAPYGSDNSSRAIILYDEKSLSTGPKDLRSRNTVEEVYTAIINDLKIAIEKLPLTWDSAADPTMAKYKILPYKAAAQMLLARVYFNMGKEHWNDALPLINTVLGYSQYGLEADPRNAYDLPKGVIPGKETIWCYSNEWWSYHDSPFIWNLLYEPNASVFTMHPGFGRAYPISQQMLNYMGWNDQAEASKDLRYTRNFIRFEAGNDPLIAYQTLNKAYVWPLKYEVSFRASLSMMRLAEMYLDKAIILFNSGDKTGAASALKVIRDRAGLPEISATAITEEDIHKERAKEMIFEGDWLRYLQCQRKDIPGTTTLKWNDSSLVLPVPLEERTYNPNI